MEFALSKYDFIFYYSWDYERNDKSAKSINSIDLQ